jgi:hypothetical protein
MNRSNQGFADNSDITEGTDRSSKRLIATAVLVKSTRGSPETAGEGFSCSTLLAVRSSKWRAMLENFI